MLWKHTTENDVINKELLSYRSSHSINFFVSDRLKNLTIKSHDVSTSPRPFSSASKI